MNVADNAALPAALLKVRRYLIIAVQLALVAAANRAAFALRFDGQEPAWAMAACLQMLPWLIAVRAVTFVPFRLYQGFWRYTSAYDLKAIVMAVAWSSIVFAAITGSPLGPDVYPRSIFVVDASLLILALGGVRFLRPLCAEFFTRAKGKRLLIVGAGDAGEMVVRDMRARTDYPYQPIGFIDDDPAKIGSRIHGVRVLGARADLARIVREQKPDEALIAIPSADVGLIREIVRALEPHNVPIKTLPRLRDIVSGKVEVQDIRTLGFEDLLARAPVGLDPERINRLVAGQRVLVTGAGGSIGGELCRQIAGMRPAALVMADRYENGLHGVYIELRSRYRDGVLHQVIADVTDTARVDELFRRHKPDIVFHAAAHKHVPLMEDNPAEAIKNNVTGTRILADAAELHGADRFILISTDKAVNPISVMGASKGLAELIVAAHAARRSGTTFTTVRFGNVLGSNGSVVPLFLEQIRHGGPVTVTHPDVQRFFMLISEAVQLVLHAAAQADNGGTYVLEMGEQIKLVDLARHLIRLAGRSEAEIPLEFVGLRPGEKLQEEIVGSSETVSPSRVDKILRVSAAPPAPETLLRIREIEAHAAEGDTAMVAELVHRVLPSYVRTARTYISEGNADKVAAFAATGASAGPPILWRGRRMPRDVAAAAMDARTAAIDLQALDAAVAVIPISRTRTFAPRDLH